MNLIFLSDVRDYSHIGFPSVFRFLFAKDKLDCVSSCVLGQATKFVAHSYWSTLVHPFLIGLCAHKLPCSFTVDVVFLWFHCDYFPLGVYAIIIV